MSLKANASTLITFIISIAFLTSQSQNTVGTIFVTPEVTEGFTLISESTNAYLLNNCGEVVNEWNSTYPPGMSVYLLPNGNLLRAGRAPAGSTISMGGAGGVIELFDWNGNLIWSYLVNELNKRQHHDIYPMPNGNVLLLVASQMSEQEALDAGRNPTLLDPDGLYNEQIIEVEPIGANQGNIVWEWNINDHLVQDFDSSKANFGIVADSPEKLDINFLNDPQSISQNWLHFNSMQYDETLDQIVISCRNLNEIYIIDHSTTTIQAAGSTGGIYGKGGDLLYRWGNPQAYQQGTIEDTKLYGQHYPHYIKSGLVDEGKILLFNNGFNRLPAFSEVIIFTPPTSSAGVYTKELGVAFGPTQVDYTYSEASENPSPFFSGIVSSAQRLETGNLLICEGRSGEIFELDPNDNLVWKYINPMSSTSTTPVNQGSEPPSTNLLFRAIKYPLDYEAFVNNDTTSGNPLEGNPDLSYCNNVLSIVSLTKPDIVVYPNPARNLVNISSNEIIDEVSVYDMNGRQLMLKKNTTSIDISSLANGLYIFKVQINTQSLTKKVLKK
jgi:hypothetical protein